MPVLLLAVAVISTAPPAAKGQARMLAAEARVAFEGGQFDRAAELLERACALEPTAELSYNLGLALERAGALDRAVQAYRRYLEELPTAPDRAAIEATIADLERRQAERSRLENLKPPPPTVIVVERPTWRIAGPVAALALGAAVLVSAGSVAAYAQSRYRLAIDSADAATAQTDLMQARGLAPPVNALWVAGGVVLAAGATWLLWELLARR
jgi:tetratricopeptide (TPR) repeat protein